MKLTQIRNATLKLEFAGVRFLIDPMLADKGAWPGFPGTARSHLRNPLVSLPLPVDTILDTDIIVLTHLHQDHWDEAAQRLVSLNQRICTQNESDAAVLRSQGFTDVVALQETNNIAGVTLIKTDGQHGSNEAYAIPEMARRLGEACGLVFQHDSEKTLYIAGDTIWVDACETTLRDYAPGVVVLNIGAAMIDGLGAIIMDKEDALRVHQALPYATLVASHMEAVNHCILSRAELHEYALSQGFSEHLLIPADGDTLTL